MHSRRSPAPNAQRSGLRISVVIYSVVAVFLGYNVLTLAGIGRDSVVRPESAGVRPSRPSLVRPKFKPKVRVVEEALGLDEDAEENAAKVAAQPPDEVGAGQQSLGAAATSCYELLCASGYTTAAEASEGDITSALCSNFVLHSASIVGVQASECTGSRAQMNPCGCSKALKAHVGGGQEAQFVGVVPPSWHALWETHRTKPVGTAPGAVLVKYQPPLWHNLISWSPQLAAAAFGAADVLVERRSWRHGKREPGHFAPAQEMIVPRSADDKQGVCAELVNTMRYLPFSPNFRALFEMELALREKFDNVSHELGNGKFEPFTSFHSVWGFKEPRRCAIDALAGAKHPAITTIYERSWENSKWLGYIDNTTGITEAVRAWNNIVRIATADVEKPRAWVDFLWHDLPSKSPAAARHLLRALSEYNPWLAHNAFTTCAPAISGLVDSPLLDMPAEIDSAQGEICVGPPPSPTTMSILADCSSRVAVADGEHCTGPVRAASQSADADTVQHALDGRVLGLLPRSLCVNVIGIRLPDVNDRDRALQDYRRLVASYSRGMAGECTRSVVYLHITTSGAVLRQALDSRQNPARSGGNAGQGDPNADNVLRLVGIDIVADFPLLDPRTDLFLSTRTFDDMTATEATLPAAYDRAFFAALQWAFSGPGMAAVKHRTTVARTEHFVDGVPRTSIAGVTDQHSDAYFDYLVLLPADVTFIPLNFHRFTTRRDVLASMYAMRVPRLIGHPAVASETANAAQRFFIVDSLMFVALRNVLFTPTCQLTDSEPALRFWTCVSDVRLKVTNPTEDRLHLVVRGEGEDAPASPFAFAILGMDAEQATAFWARKG
jgi:hypothetical protein